MTYLRLCRLQCTVQYYDKYQSNDEDAKLVFSCCYLPYADHISIIIIIIFRLEISPAALMPISSRQEIGVTGWNTSKLRPHDPEVGEAHRESRVSSNLQVHEATVSYFNVHSRIRYFGRVHAILVVSKRVWVSSAKNS